MVLLGIPDLIQSEILRAAFKNCSDAGADLLVTWTRFLSFTFLIHFNTLLACIPAGNFDVSKRFFHLMTKILKRTLFVWTVKMCSPNEYLSTDGSIVD
jgi:hypothetical protein